MQKHCNVLRNSFVLFRSDQISYQWNAEVCIPALDLFSIDVNNKSAWVWLLAHDKHTKTKNIASCSIFASQYMHICAELTGY